MEIDQDDNNWVEMDVDDIGEASDSSYRASSLSSSEGSQPE
jgi:hypothetical protein